jgi:uncharacterized membrane protein (DUF4010 family)
MLIGVIVAILWIATHFRLFLIIIGIPIGIGLTIMFPWFFFVIILQIGIYWAVSDWAKKREDMIQRIERSNRGDSGN